jgi:hypothetical protein
LLWYAQKYAHPEPLPSLSGRFPFADGRTASSWRSRNGRPSRRACKGPCARPIASGIAAKLASVCSAPATKARRAFFAAADILSSLFPAAPSEGGLNESCRVRLQKHAPIIAKFISPFWMASVNPPPNVESGLDRLSGECGM